MSQCLLCNAPLTPPHILCPICEAEEEREIHSGSVLCALVVVSVAGALAAVAWAVYSATK